jgi:regulator of protease activity HflC (stomatin/prohibitin superfamily)
MIPIPSNPHEQFQLNNNKVPIKPPTKLVRQMEANERKEKEEMRAIQEELREEEKARREIEQAQREAEKDEANYQRALEKAKKEIERIYLITLRL